MTFPSLHIRIHSLCNYNQLSHPCSRFLMARRNKCLKISRTRKMALAVSSCRSIGVLGCRLGSYRLKPRMDCSSLQSPRGQDLSLKPLGWLWVEQRPGGLSQPTAYSPQQLCDSVSALHITCRWFWPDSIFLPCSLLSVSLN